MIFSYYAAIRPERRRLSLATLMPTYATPLRLITLLRASVDCRRYEGRLPILLMRMIRSRHIFCVTDASPIAARHTAVFAAPARAAMLRAYRHFCRYRGCRRRFFCYARYACDICFSHTRD